MNTRTARIILTFLTLCTMLWFAVGCEDSSVGNANSSTDGRIVVDGGNNGGSTGDDLGQGIAAVASVLLVIDEDCIDNGNKPNIFSETDVNDQKASLGMRDQLRYFQNNVGRTINLYTGEVGDEGLYALRSIPSSWISTGPTDNGATNFVLAGPGLGSPNRDDDREAYLDKIPNVTPLRARGLKMLVGQTVFAVVFDGDVATNYSPLDGSLKGETLGLVAFRIEDVRERTDGSTGSLPRITVTIQDTDQIRDWPFYLFSNAPVPKSSSEPYDVNPPKSVGQAVLTPAP